MMMNSILGFEAGSVGKVPAVTGESSKKSNSSSDFADLVAAQSGRERAASDAVSGERDPAEPEAGTESDGLEAEGAGTGKEKAGAEMPEAGLGAPEDVTKLPETDAGLAEPAAKHPDAEAGLAQADPNEKPLGSTSSHTASEGAIAAGQERSASDPDTERKQMPPVSTGRSDGPEQAVGWARGQNQADAVSGQTVTVDKPARTQAAGQHQAEAAPSRDAAKLPDTSANPQASEAKEANATARVAPEMSAKAAAIADAQPPAGRRQSSTAAGQGDKGIAVAGQAPAASIHAAAPASVTSNSPLMQADAQQAVTPPEGAVRSRVPAAPGMVQALTTGQAAPKGPGHRADAATTVLSSDAPADAEAVETGRLISGVLKAGEIRTAAAASAPQPLQPATAILQPLMAGGLAAGSPGAELLSGSDDLLPGAFGLSGEVPGLTQLLAEASIGTGTVHRPETPRMVAAQLAEAFAAKGEQKVEVSLNPQELGHVRMRVVAGETGITMIIQTERPETGDLMRRHIHELAEEFRRMGYEDISFEFSGGQTGGQSANDADGGAGSSSGGAGSRSADAADATEPVTQNLRLGETGVDMRV
ncbi:flagellar hook-length control protein FliK [Leisingera caerulea]|uniref:Flagellar hook-length control protein FliK n=1 Tax=Leisingera caerulea TaxID=506591 RepID=A0A9Q9M2V0_LEICA|nr:flagellar hook-length control protein FliK [Leisingera caerulea]UWQ53918.1 flagellar hook-length control protein FliK [Leisingera caerulea]